jgi:hypothetical protein
MPKTSEEILAIANKIAELSHVLHNARGDLEWNTSELARAQRGVDKEHANVAAAQDAVSKAEAEFLEAVKELQ